MAAPPPPPAPSSPAGGRGERTGRERTGSRVVVVTDSTASLPAGAAERWGIEVVPLEVALGDARYREGVDLPVADLLAALAGGTRVTTSQPPPHAFGEAYARAAGRGADAVVSVHLSGELSGTVRAAELAARSAPLPVHVVDSRTVAMGLGFAALAAAELAAGGRPELGGEAGRGGSGGGGSGGGGAAGAVMPGGVVPGAVVPGSATPGGAPAEEVAERARVVAASTSVLFVVDSLEHLRRGGRIGAAAAAVGGLLGMRPLLTVRTGSVEVAGTVRTRRAARERLVGTVVAELATRPDARVAVHHLGSPDVGEGLAEELRAAGASEVLVADVSAVVGAHAGPGLVGVVVATR